MELLPPSTRNKKALPLLPQQFSQKETAQGRREEASQEPSRRYQSFAQGPARGAGSGALPTPPAQARPNTSSSQPPWHSLTAPALQPPTSHTDHLHGACSPELLAGSSRTHAAPAAMGGGATAPHSWLVLLKLWGLICTEQVSILKREFPSFSQKKGINPSCSALPAGQHCPSVPQKGAQGPLGPVPSGCPQPATCQGLDGPFTHLLLLPSVPLLPGLSHTSRHRPQRWAFPPGAPS